MMALANYAQVGLVGPLSTWAVTLVGQYLLDTLVVSSGHYLSVCGDWNLLGDSLTYWFLVRLDHLCLLLEYLVMVPDCHFWSVRMLGYTLVWIHVVGGRVFGFGDPMSRGEYL